MRARWAGLFRLLAVLALLAFWALGALHWVGTDGDYHLSLHRQLGASQATGLTWDGVERATQALVQCLMTGDTAPLSYEDQVYGAVQPVFNEREITHMVDVAALFVLLRQVLWALAAAALAFALLSLLLDRGKANPRQDAAPKRFPHPGESPAPAAPSGNPAAGDRAAASAAPAEGKASGGRALRAWGKALIGGSALFLGLAGLLALACALDFNRAFLAFHHLFFTNDLWLLNPATDLMIRLLPETFFAQVAGRAALLALLGPAGALVLGILLNRIGRKRL